MFMWYKTLAILLSTHQNYYNWWTFDEVLTQTVCAVFFRHGVEICRWKLMTWCSSFCKLTFCRFARAASSLMAFPVSNGSDSSERTWKLRTSSATPSQQDGRTCTEQNWWCPGENIQFKKHALFLFKKTCSLKIHLKMHCSLLGTVENHENMEAMVFVSSCDFSQLPRFWQFFCLFRSFAQFKS